MPIYEYQCTKCGERFQVRQAYGEDGAKMSCPNCRAVNPRRLLSSFFTSSSVASANPSGDSCPTCSSGVCDLPPM